MIRASSRVSQSMFPLIMKGNSLNGALFSAKIAPSPNATPSRFAVVVSKKVAKTAVSRNRLRRRGYAALRLLSPLCSKGHLVAFFAKQGALSASASELRADIQNILSKSRILRLP